MIERLRSVRNEYTISSLPFPMRQYVVHGCVRKWRHNKTEHHIIGLGHLQGNLYATGLTI